MGGSLPSQTDGERIISSMWFGRRVSRLANRGCIKTLFLAKRVIDAFACCLSKENRALTELAKSKLSQCASSCYHRLFADRVGGSSYLVASHNGVTGYEGSMRQLSGGICFGMTTSFLYLLMQLQQGGFELSSHMLRVCAREIAENGSQTSALVQLATGYTIQKKISVLPGFFSLNKTLDFNLSDLSDGCFLVLAAEENGGGHALAFIRIPGDSHTYVFDPNSGLSKFTEAQLHEYSDFVLKIYGTKILLKVEPKA